MEKAAAKRGPADEWPDDDWFVEEGALIDDALGLAFVTCQLFITAVVSGCQCLHRFHASYGKSMAGGGGRQPIGLLCWDKRQLLQRNNPMVGASGISGVAAIDALANYFKHRDEWPNDWKYLKGSQELTATTLRKLGLLKDMDGTIVRAGDLRDGFKLLARHDQHDRLRDLKAILDGWPDELMKGYECEFKTLNLVN